MPNYRELYLQMMRATEKSTRTLVEAQQACEEMILREADDEAQQETERRT